MNTTTTTTSKSNRRPCLFRERDVSRAIRAVIAAGLKVERVTITPTGDIHIFPTPADKIEPTDYADDRNEWD
jgi:hypothetical protein